MVPFTSWAQCDSGSTSHLIVPLVALHVVLQTRESQYAHTDSLAVNVLGCKKPFRSVAKVRRKIQ